VLLSPPAQPRLLSGHRGLASNSETTQLSETTRTSSAPLAAQRSTSTLAAIAAAPSASSWAPSRRGGRPDVVPSSSSNIHVHSLAAPKTGLVGGYRQHAKSGEAELNMVDEGDEDEDSDDTIGSSHGDYDSDDDSDDAAVWVGLKDMDLLMKERASSELPSQATSPRSSWLRGSRLVFLLPSF